MRYATPTTWAEHFEKNDNVIIDYRTINKRLCDAEVIGVSCRSKTGRVFINSFFSELDVRKVCSDILNNLFVADETGFFKKDGKKYGTIEAWSKIFPISVTAIGNCIQRSKLTSVKGRTSMGNVTDFYSEADIQSVCSKILNPELYKADETGFFEKDGKKYGTREAWSTIVPISPTSITSHIQNHKIKSIKGKTVTGRIVDFYSEEDIRLACAKHLGLNQTDKNGFFEKNGKKWGTAKAWSREFSISSSCIIRRIKKFKIKSIKGKDVIRRIVDFYSEEDVRSVCSEQIGSNLIQADKTNFFEKDGKKYGTVGAWSKILTISNTTIQNNLDKFQIKPIEGRDSTSRVRTFYSEEDIKLVCVKRLSLNQADDSGFFEKDGKKYGTVHAWSKVICISTTTIRSYVKKFQIKPIKGKDVICRIADFYSEEDIMSICSKHIELELTQADETNFFEKNGKKYGTMEAWGRILPISRCSVWRHVKKSKIKSVQGKDSTGRIRAFYSESDVRSACSDLLEKRNPHAA